MIIDTVLDDLKMALSEGKINLDEYQREYDKYLKEKMERENENSINCHSITSRW